MNARLGAILAVLGLAASAAANGAMGLGLEMFDLRYWFAYVVAMVVLEAWLIGRWAGIGWPVALGLSVLANLITGVMCGGMGCFAPFLHMAFVGNQIDPKPFLNAVALLIGFSVPSGWVESLVWRKAARATGDNKLVGRSILVHLATVPVGLAILLIPDQPYRGLEATTAWRRRMVFNMDLRKAAQQYLYVKLQVPVETDPLALGRLLDGFRENQEGPSLTYAFFEPDYSRFSMGETWRKPFEVNKAVAGRKFPENSTSEEERWVWWIRPKDKQIERQVGFAIEINSGLLERTTDRKRLGYIR